MPEPANVASGPLSGMYNAYRQKLSTHIAMYGYTAFGKGSGTLTNLQQGITFMLTLGDPETIMNGCLALQDATFSVCNENSPAGYTIKKIMVGFGMEHHAVAVFPAGTIPSAGYVFDPWITQSPQVYTYPEWLSGFTILNGIAEVRIEN